MKIAIINGPNLNLLGKRETDIYGDQSFDIFFKSLQEKFPQCTLSYYQSNIEGELVNAIQEYGFNSDGI
ncbi:MAG: 3-dehydroquinate dehydratase, partial [Chitinophagaceae bacterium]|nr:3-dehydroquinate dehydratase [Chitinophagaceae bacterium]